ncbi:MAG: class I SAM-dependent methyltransferase [Pseudomonadota bacterium]
MSDRQTLDYYSEEAATYAEFVGDAKDDPNLTRFIDAMPRGARVLDFGCGHGWASAQMQSAGLAVTAIDGSPGLAAEAKARYRLDVKVMLFSDFAEEAAYDGIWASFSLLHDSRAALPGHLARLRRAARANALLFLGLKAGEGEVRDHLGRMYSYFSEAELRGHLTTTGWGEITCETQRLPGLAGKEEDSLLIFARAI